MKKSIITIIIVFSSLLSEAQESAAKLKLYAANVGFGFYYIAKNGVEDGGATFLADATFSIEKNLISASYLTGAQVGILRNSEHHFDELSLLYGRDWKVANWLHFEGFAGLGYYNQKSETIEIADDNSVSFPLRLNSKLYFTKKFGMGINTNYSINSVNNNLSFNLLFHYKFN